MAFGKTLTSVKDVLATIAQILERADSEIAYIVPHDGLTFAAQYSFLRDGAKKLVQNGGHIRGVTDISHNHINAARQLLEIGEDLRHADEAQQVLMLVRDRKESVSSMNMGTEELLVDEPIAAFWTDDETYAEYLLSSFEMAWARAIPARQRLKELDK